MKKMIFFGLVGLLLPIIVYAQEKIEAPVWNVGDKWVFTQGNIEVVGADEKSYTLNFSKDTCILENMGFEKLIFEKSTLNRTYVLKGDKREEYTIAQRRLLNFPFHVGKKWDDNIFAKRLTGEYKGETHAYIEAFRVLGWENVKVQAGNFKTIKLEYTMESRALGRSGTAIYWYAPEVKYFVKCQYDPSFWWKEVADWELASFKLKE